MRTPTTSSATRKRSKQSKYFGLCKSTSAVRCHEDLASPSSEAPPTAETASTEEGTTVTELPMKPPPSKDDEGSLAAAAAAPPTTTKTLSLSLAGAVVVVVGVLVRVGAPVLLVVPAAGFILFSCSRQPSVDTVELPKMPLEMPLSPVKYRLPPSSAQVDALRAYGEGLHDRKLPTVLDMDSHLERLLSRKNRDFAWAQRKLAEAVEFRRNPPGTCVDGLLSTSAEAPRSYHALKPYLPSDICEEPLLSLECLLNAGRVFKNGNMYIKGIDTQGRPIVWSQPKLVDWENVQVENAVRALATMSELIALAGKWVGKTKGVCIEYSTIGDSSANKHGKKLLAYMRQLTDILQKGYAERSGDVVLAPTNAIFRAAFACFKPLFPESIRDSIKLYSLKQGRKRIVELLGDPEALPTFWGGPHEISFRKLADSDDLDVCAMMLDFLELVPDEPSSA